MSQTNIEYKNAIRLMAWLASLKPGQKPKKYSSKQNIEIITKTVFIDVQKGLEISARTENVKTSLGTTSKQLVLNVHIPRVICRYYDAPGLNSDTLDLSEGQPVKADAFPYKLTVDVDNFVVEVEQHLIRAEPSTTKYPTRETARAFLSSGGTIHFAYDPGVASQNSITRHAIEMLIESILSHFKSQKTEDTTKSVQRNKAFCDLATPL